MTTGSTPWSCDRRSGAPWKLWLTTSQSAAEPDCGYDVIIGNPPYSLALDFINKSLELLHPGGLLIFLLRTNFLESEKRFKWWQEHPLSGLYTLHKRPSFTGRGTDATSYSWFVWERGGPAA